QHGEARGRGQSLPGHARLRNFPVGHAVSTLSVAWLPGLLRRRLVVALALALVASLAGSAVVRATFAATRSNPGNSFAAATLAAPGSPTSVHATTSGTGTVTLTWAPSTTSWTQSYLVY